MAVAIVLVGTYATVLNATVIGVCLPSIGASFDSGPGGVALDWVVTGFLTGVVVALPATAWFSDRAGRKVAYTSSLVVFLVGAVICMLAPTMLVLVVGRFVQGFGGGAVLPIGMAIVYDLFPPHRRGSALGMWGIAMMAAPAAGPALGGWIIGAAGWRWVFGVFVVIAEAGLLLAIRCLPEVGHRVQRQLDALGWALAAASVVLVVVGMRSAGGWGLTSPRTVAVVVAAIGCIGVLIRRSLRRVDPIIDFRMFAVRTYSAAMVVGALLLMCQLTYLTFLPIELQVLRGMDAQQVGILLAPSAVGTAMMMPVSGWLVDRIGARVPVLLGAGLLATSMWRLSHIDGGSSELEVAGILLVQGLGMGSAFIPTQVAAMNCLPGRLVSQASAVSNLTRQLGGVVGVALASAVLVADLGAIAPTGPRAIGVQSAYNRIFTVAFGFALAAGTVALLLPGRRVSRSHQSARSEESER